MTMENYGLLLFNVMNYNDAIIIQEYIDNV